MSYPVRHLARDRRRDRWLPFVVAAMFAVTAACQGEAPAGGRVLKVFDGDSFIMRDEDGTEIEVRLFGIDAPERRQPWSRRSRQALKGILGGHAIDAETVTIDRYGRTVAVVRRRSDGLSVNEEMVRQGHAWVYRRYTDDPTLLRLEEQARAAGTGLWGLPEAERIPPWRWRREQRAGAGSGSRG
jgi:endonuclease YncB( thermonuclease family)